MLEIIKQSLNIKERKLLELLQMHLKSVADGRTDGVDPLLDLRFAKATHVL